MSSCKAEQPTRLPVRQRAQAARLYEKWGDDIPRRVLESIALEGYRSRILGESQLRRLLGLATRFDVHAFLKEHEVSLYTLDDLQHDRETLRQLGI